MKSVQETQAKTSENPAKPGDFGTNVTQGVVLSRMSETTKRALGADQIDLSVPWSRRIDQTHLAAPPVDQQALRASRFGAEGSAERETINSPAEVGAGCTGRKMALVKWLIMVMQAMVAALLISDVGLVFGLLIWGYSFATGALLAKFWAIPFFEANRARRMAR